MYGLINKAVFGLVSERFGIDAWHRIRTRAGLPDEPFLSMEQYPDKSTFDLVAAATVELNIPAEDILKEFGKYWTLYTAKAGYGDLMDSAGRTLGEFVKNLDQLHSRVKLSFPHLQPPSFSVSDEGPHHLTLHYYSIREGLAPLVIGILMGLGERFQLNLSFDHESVTVGPRPHEVIRISWSEAGGHERAA
ncbi:MAG: hypothetical protein RL417_2029 [Pseudomonadota bacterium]|jgi:hypothetical protein